MGESVVDRQRSLSAVVLLTNNEQPNIMATIITLNFIVVLCFVDKNVTELAIGRTK